MSAIDWESKSEKARKSHDCCESLMQYLRKFCDFSMKSFANATYKCGALAKEKINEGNKCQSSLTRGGDFYHHRFGDPGGRN